MAATPESARVYIVYRHGLFAEGIRSLLRDQPSIRIIGAERDKTKALKEVGTLKPTVVLIEESATDPEEYTTWNLLHRQGTRRVIALNLEHNAVTVYDRESLPMSTPVDLLHAVRGYAHASMSNEPTARPGRGARAPAAPRAKAPIPQGKAGPRKGRA